MSPGSLLGAKAWQREVRVLRHGMDQPTPDPDNATAPSPPVDAGLGQSLWSQAWARLAANRAAVVSVILLAVVALLSILGPFLTGHAFDKVYTGYVRTQPSLTGHPTEAEIVTALSAIAQRLRAEVKSVVRDPTAPRTGQRLVTLENPRAIDQRSLAFFARSDLFLKPDIVEQSADGQRLVLRVMPRALVFLAGTDGNGRDLLTRTFVAGRVSLAIGLLAAMVALVIGVAYGATAGTIGGRVDAVMMRFVDVLYALPFIFFVILLVVFFGRNFILMFLAVGAVEWLDMARIVRGQALSIRQREYVAAAEALGVSTAGIVWRHIIPNALGPVVVYMTLLVPKVILLESFLSFLGLGVQEPMTSWGVLIADGARDIEGAPYLLIVPAAFLVTTLFALNFLGDGLRDALDPKDR